MRICISHSFILIHYLTPKTEDTWNKPVNIKRHLSQHSYETWLKTCNIFYKCSCELTSEAKLIAWIRVSWLVRPIIGKSKYFYDFFDKLIFSSGSQCCVKSFCHLHVLTVHPWGTLVFQKSGFSKIRKTRITIKCLTINLPIGLKVSIAQVRFLGPFLNMINFSCVFYLLPWHGVGL